MSPHGSDNPTKELVSDAGNGMNELKPQEHAVADAQHRTRNESISSVNNTNKPEISEPHKNPMNQEHLRHDHHRTAMDQAVPIKAAEPSQEHIKQEQGALDQNVSADLAAPATRISSPAPRAERSKTVDHAMNESWDQLANLDSDENDMEAATPSAPVPTENARTPVDIAPVLVKVEDTPTLAAVPESVRGNPYALASPTAAFSQPAVKEEVDVNDDEVTLDQHEAPFAMAKVKGGRLHPGASPDDVVHVGEIEHGTPPRGQQVTEQNLDHDGDDEEESVEMEYTQNDASTESGSDDDDEEDDGRMATMQAQFQAARAKAKLYQQSSRPQLSQGDSNFLNPQRGQSNGHFEGYLQNRQQSGYESFGDPSHMQRFPVNAYDDSPHGSPSMPASRNLANSWPEGRQEEVPNHCNFGQTPMSMSRLPPQMSPDELTRMMASLGSYGAPNGQRQNASIYQDPMGYPNIGYSMPAFSEQCPVSAYSPYPMPMPTQNTQAQTFAEQCAHTYIPRGYHLSPQQQNAQKARTVKENDGTDDDDTFRTCVPRHRSVLSDRNSVMGNDDEHDCGDGDDDIEYLRTLVIESTKTPTTTNKAQKVQEAPPELKAKPKPKRPANPKTPQPSGPTKATSDASTPSSIDWRLPVYEATFEPGKTKNDPTIAKISIPGLIREEVVLSIEHADQEAAMFLNIFLPGQEARAADPEPFPAQAILNFHNIALMVIEAYTQFEIGDEFGTGRGHWHDNHDQGKEEYARLRDAKDADPDEIFFAVIDRWRAGLESGKDGAKMIRGSQEFCDVALECVWYVKENGLNRQMARKVRSDRGFKRGARKVGEVERGAVRDGGMGAGGAKGKPAAKGKGAGKDEDGKIAKTSKSVKRGANDANTLDARKKTKTTPAKAGTIKATSARKSRKTQSKLTVLRPGTTTTAKK